MEIFDIPKLPDWTELKEEEKEIFRNKVSNIVNIINDINFEGFTVLTGSNGSGKSMLRQQVGLKFSKDEDKNPNKRKVKSISMQLRTSSNSSWGALSGAMLDNEWSPTSLNTLQLIDGVLRAADIFDKPEPGTIKSLSDTGYIIIDEPEIGMSEEAQLSLAYYLIKCLPLFKKSKIGLMLITHSRVILDIINHYVVFNNVNLENIVLEDWVDSIPEFSFVNLDGYKTIEDYLNREIKSLDLSTLKANYLFYALQERMDKGKK